MSPNVIEELSPQCVQGLVRELEEDSKQVAAQAALRIAANNARIGELCAARTQAAKS